ncbi:hypothetical protein BSKO_04715 [Bryopsis sp. KO-2023]|nr:hypothetical protein BSKO_04715 [Bryopsis sp. KO-2023]
MRLAAACLTVLWAFAQAQIPTNILLAPGPLLTTTGLDLVEGNNGAPTYGSPKPAIFASAVNDLGLKLLAQARKSDKKGNLVFSPLSLSAAFSLLHFGAKGEAKKNLDWVFGFQDGIVPGLIKAKAEEYKYNGDQSVALANRAFFQEDIPIKSSYKNAVGESNIDKLNFSKNPEGSREAINLYVAATTNGLIKEGVPPGAIDSSTVFALVNAVFFQGAWESPFDKKNTVTGKFRGTKGPQDVEYMGDEGSIDILWRNVPELNAQAMELPYAGGQFSMFIVLPDTENGWIAAEKNLARVLTKGLLFNGATSKPVSKLKIPKFDLDGQLPNLKQHLQDMGLQSLFSGADLSGISGKPLSLSEIVHKAKVKIDEEGTTAAAVSSALFQKSILTDEFVVDRPFLFFIVEKTEGTIWFQGTVTHF